MLELRQLSTALPRSDRRMWAAPYTTDGFLCLRERRDREELAWEKNEGQVWARNPMRSHGWSRLARACGRRGPGVRQE
ncbi:hypothetical protein E2C01_025211 [Portunus trituberculatus]|uniref:Uncharacterized protein n=1 Tax=Portunus trituberculatus TaxID=210409 RepID=A0A5B7ECM9_PORTR|nr:hypothetical protein [Portunus trituberculatus]